LKALYVIVAAIFGAVIVGATAQAIWLQTRLAEAGVDGTLVDIGGRKIHLHCSGQGRASYVLEAGAVGFGEMWQWIRAGLEADARVCTYDRAGLGASDPGAEPFEPGNVVRDLIATLDAAEEKGPFVLVGHSLGGVFVRSFAAAHPDAVAALVLVDPTHEDQLSQFDQETAGHFETLRRMVRTMSILSRTGLLQLWNPLSSVVVGLDGSSRERANLYIQDPGTLTAAAAELDAWETIMAHRRGMPINRSLPVLVITAGSIPGRNATMRNKVLEMHGDLASRSAAGMHEVFEHADHFSLLTDRETAARLAGRIRRFAETVERRAADR